MNNHNMPPMMAAASAPAVTPDLTYFGQQTDQAAIRDQVTPYKVSLLVLIDYHLRTGGRDPDSDPDTVINQKEERDIMILMLELVQSSDLELRDLFVRLEEIGWSRYVTALSERLSAVCASGVSDLMDLFQTVPDELFMDTTACPLLHRSSVIGLYVRRLQLAFDKLTFSQVTKLHRQFTAFVAASAGSSKSSDAGLFGAKTSPTEDESEAAGDDGCLDDTDASISMADMGGVTPLRPPPPIRDEHDVSGVSTGGAAIHNTSSDTARFSQRQAEYLIAQQASLLQHNEREALAPRCLQARVTELLNSNPQLAEAHFLSFLNSLRVSEYVGAVESLFHYFDRKMQPPPVAMETTPVATSLPSRKQDDDTVNRNFRYAALNLAALHYRFGHWQECVEAVNEAIKLAQEFNDHVCLQHALGWLQRLGLESSSNSGFMLDRLVCKAGELNMPYVMSLGIQAFARHNALATFPPANVFELMTRSDILNCQHSQAGLMCSSLAQKAALWALYGKREMCSLNAQLMLHLNTSDLGVYHNGEAECLGLCHLSRLHAQQGLYEIAFDIIDSAKRRFPTHSQHAHIWMLQEQELIFERAILHGRHSVAETAVANMRAASSSEAEYSECVLLKEKGELSTAFVRVRGLREAGRGTQEAQRGPRPQGGADSPELQARLLLLEGELAVCSGNAAGAIAPLLECLTLCRDHHLDHRATEARLQLAHAQYRVGMPHHALHLLAAGTMTRVLAHGSLLQRARAHALAVRCQIASTAPGGDGGSERRHKVLLSCVQALGDVVNWFRSAEAHLRTKDTVYLQALLYHELGYTSERNKCALQFRHLHQQYPTCHKAALLAL